MCRVERVQQVRDLALDARNFILFILLQLGHFRLELLKAVLLLFQIHIELLLLLIVALLGLLELLLDLLRLLLEPRVLGGQLINFRLIFTLQTTLDDLKFSCLILQGLDSQRFFDQNRPQLGHIVAIVLFQHIYQCDAWLVVHRRDVDRLNGTRCDGGLTVILGVLGEPRLGRANRIHRPVEFPVFRI